MMKRLFPITFLLLSVVGFTCCSHEEDNIFDKSAAERLNEVSGIYTQRLAASKGGWVMEYYPYSDNENMVIGGGYLIMNRFHNNGAVYTLMKNSLTGNKIQTDSSAYQVITDMGPVLTYNTYNKNLGLFSDPYDIPSTSDDEKGKGFRGDYEFVMVDVPEDGDHIMLKGKKRGLYERLSRVPEGTDFEAYLDDIENFKSSHFIKDAPWELQMNEGGTRYLMNWMYRGYATVYPEGKDSVAYGWQEPYLITKYNEQYHLRFKDTVMVDGHQMEQEFTYNAEDDKFYGVLDNNNTIEGADPTRHFVDYMQKGHKWQFSSASDISGPMVETFETVVADFKSKKYDVKLVNFSISGENGRVSLSVKSGSSTVEIIYLYDMTVAEDGSYTITYREPYVTSSNKRASQILTTVPTLSAFLESANGTYRAEQATGTAFDLRKLKLTCSNGNTLLVLGVK